jgi:hypothetical protein
MRREPGAWMMRRLEGRAEALAGTFNAQAVANTLWAYAMMGREPGEGSRRELEGRLAGTMNAQDEVNTLWAYATMGREPGAAGGHVQGKFRRRAPLAQSTANLPSFLPSLPLPPFSFSSFLPLPPRAKFRRTSEDGGAERVGLMMSFICSETKNRSQAP